MPVTEAAAVRTADPSLREIVTPEGVPLRLRLARRGERLAAVLIDFSLILTLLVMVTIAMVTLWRAEHYGWEITLGLLLSFAIRSFYFIFFELRWRGVTPGKRIMGLQVVDRGGGRLKAEAVFARNLMREVELFLPVTLIVSDGLWGISGSTALTLLWIALLAGLPCFNKDRLRPGDLIAGTWVVETPKVALLPDMAATADLARGSERIKFSEKQLSVYGIYELQTLETLLRREDANAREIRESVAQRIQRKIDWPASRQAISTDRFLEAFYAALRGHLERRALFGKRRRDKFDLG